MKPREPRHTVLIQARMRAESGWGDVLIHNVSRRGMMLRAANPPRKGSYVEIRKATMVIVARAVWVRDQMFGVRTQDVVDLPDLLDQTAQQLSASMGLSPPAGGDRRKAPRASSLTPDQAAARNRQRSALAQFALFGIVALGAAGLVASQVHGLLTAPITAVEHALGASSGG